MSKSSQPANAGNIVFMNQDDPLASETLRAALQHADEVPILGLVVKVKEGKTGEQVVNWMFADATFVKSLALSTPKE